MQSFKSYEKELDESKNRFDILFQRNKELMVLRGMDEKKIIFLINSQQEMQNTINSLEQQLFLEKK